MFTFMHTWELRFVYLTYLYIFVTICFPIPKVRPFLFLFLTGKLQIRQMIKDNKKSESASSTSNDVSSEKMF